MFSTQTLYENIEAERGRHGWTMQEVDAHEIAFLLDQLVRCGDVGNTNQTGYQRVSVY
jgi:hypothetical protein